MGILEVRKGGMPPLKRSALPFITKLNPQVHSLS